MMRILVATLLLVSLAKPSSSWISSARLGVSRETRNPRQNRLPPLESFRAELPSLNASLAQSASNRIYSNPPLYDLAFGYRDYDKEVDFLLKMHKEATGEDATRILELGAGPARHSQAALKAHENIKNVTCIDLSPEMIVYAKELALRELNEKTRDKIKFVLGDMRRFERLQEQADTAWILLGSLQHLTENSDVIECFQSVQQSLTEEGTLIVELPHPRELFAMIDCTRNGWTVPLHDDRRAIAGELSIIWGDEFDYFDPIRQVRQFTVEMEVLGGMGPVQNIREVVPMRLFTAREIDALAYAAGFRVKAMYGALEKGVDVNDEDAAFRLVCVLQKRR